MHFKMEHFTKLGMLQMPKTMTGGLSCPMLLVL